MSATGTGIDDDWFFCLWISQAKSAPLEKR